MLKVPKYVLKNQSIYAGLEDAMIGFAGGPGGKTRYDGGEYRRRGDTRKIRNSW